MIEMAQHIIIIPDLHGREFWREAVGELPWTQGWCSSATTWIHTKTNGFIGWMLSRAFKTSLR